MAKKQLDRENQGRHIIIYYDACITLGLNTNELLLFSLIYHYNYELKQWWKLDYKQVSLWLNSHENTARNALKGLLKKNLLDVQEVRKDGLCRVYYKISKEITKFVKPQIESKKVAEVKKAENPQPKVAPSVEAPTKIVKPKNQVDFEANPHSRIELAQIAVDLYRDGEFFDKDYWIDWVRTIYQNGGDLSTDRFKKEYAKLIFRKDANLILQNAIANKSKYLFD